jgi:ATP-binding cassette subfamily B protein
MDKGVKVEEGTHDELLAKEGFYWRLYEAQQRQEEADRVAMMGGGASHTDSDA